MALPNFRGPRGRDVAERRPLPHPHPKHMAPQPPPRQPVLLWRREGTENRPFWISYASRSMLYGFCRSPVWIKGGTVDTEELPRRRRSQRAAPIYAPWYACATRGRTIMRGRQREGRRGTRCRATFTRRTLSHSPSVRGVPSPRGAGRGRQPTDAHALTGANPEVAARGVLLTLGAAVSQRQMARCSPRLWPSGTAEAA